MMHMETIQYNLPQSRFRRPGTTSFRSPQAPGAVLHPGTLKPIGPDDLAPLFPMA